MAVNLCRRKLRLLKSFSLLERADCLIKRINYLLAIIINVTRVKYKRNYRMAFESDYDEKEALLKLVITFVNN